MGGILKAPKAPPMPTLKPQPQPDYSADEALVRRENLDRRRRGRAGTVKTSERGLVRPNALAPQKKSLLGE